MQISRHLLMTCAVATFLTPTFVHAADNEAQIRARQALEEKMKQMGAQPAAATSTPPAAVQKPAVPRAQPSSADSDRVRRALEEKMRQMQTQTPPPAPKAAPKPETVQNPPAQTAPAFAPEISQPATPAPVAPTMSAPAVSMQSTDSATADRLHQALHQKMREAEPEPAVTPAPPQRAEMPKRGSQSAPAVVKAPPAQPEQPAATTSAPTYSQMPEPSNVVRPTLPETPTPQPAPTVAHNKQSVPEPLNLPALTGPASSLSAAKQQKLDALLQQYRMDQLTPQQYHEQRAKILAEP